MGYHDFIVINIPEGIANFLLLLERNLNLYSFIYNVSLSGVYLKVFILVNINNNCKYINL